MTRSVFCNEETADELKCYGVELRGRVTTAEELFDIMPDEIMDGELSYELEISKTQRGACVRYVCYSIAGDDNGEDYIEDEYLIMVEHKNLGEALGQALLNLYEEGYLRPL